jgi:hypothetical protein
MGNKIDIQGNTFKSVTLKLAIGVFLYKLFKMPIKETHDGII